MLPTSFTRMKSPPFCAGAKKVPVWGHGNYFADFFKPTKQTKV